MRGLRLIQASFVVCVAGCSLPLIGDSPYAGISAEQEVGRDTAALAAPIVQVRDFPHSAVASVFAWEPDDAQLGLSTSVSRTGKLVGGLRAGDHQLYMDVYEARRMGGFKYATVTLGHLLLPIRAHKDSQACYYGRVCTPMITLGVRIPDSLLRAHRDNFVVTFHPSALEEWTVTMRPALVTAYLQTVDSLVAARH
jgi:hypothetical protein